MAIGLIGLLIAVIAFGPWLAMGLAAAGVILAMAGLILAAWSWWQSWQACQADPACNPA